MTVTPEQLLADTEASRAQALEAEPLELAGDAVMPQQYVPVVAPEPPVLEPVAPLEGEP